MSNAIISLLLSIGASVWIYNKMYSRTGGNTKSALITAGATAGLLFFVMLFLLSLIPS